MNAPEVVLAGTALLVAVVNCLVNPSERARAVALLALAALLLLIAGRCFT